MLLSADKKLCLSACKNQYGLGLVSLIHSLFRSVPLLFPGSLECVLQIADVL